MSLQEKIETDIKTAMKEKDTVKVSTLRMVKADINNTILYENKKGLTEDEVVKIIQRQIKRHKDSIEQFEKGNRADLVEKEKKELDILLAYMPEQCSPEELKKIVAETVKELGATSKKDMGKVIKTVMEKVKGKAEGKEVSGIVAGMLN